MKISLSLFLVLNYTRDFPGGPVVKNPPANARDAGSIPGRGTKIPHAVGQLSPTTQPEKPLIPHNQRKPVRHNGDPAKPNKQIMAPLLL